MKFEINYFTDKGLKRNNNEDYFGFVHNVLEPLKTNKVGIHENNEASVLVVCDGMGGLEAGEIASKETTDFILNYIIANIRTSNDIECLIKDSLIKANQNLLFYQSKNRLTNEMGTTAVVSVILNNFCYLGWVGDSRAYLYREGALNRITKDHSKVQEDVDAGIITEEESFYSDESHIITQSIGQYIDPNPGIVSLNLKTNDKIFLCTDGVCGEIQDFELEQCFEKKSNLEIIDQIKNAVFDVYANDNFTMILFQIIELSPHPEVNQDFEKYEITNINYNKKDFVTDKIVRKESNNKLLIIFLTTLVIGLIICVLYFIKMSAVTKSREKTILNQDSIKEKQIIISKDCKKKISDKNTIEIKSDNLKIKLKKSQKIIPKSLLLNKENHDSIETAKKNKIDQSKNFNNNTDPSQKEIKKNKQSEELYKKLIIPHSN